MSISKFSRYALSCVAVTMFAGCGGSSQSTAALPHSSETRPAKHNQSGSLLYIGAAKTSYVLSYPEGKIVGTIAQTGLGVCSDTSGTVYFASDNSLLVFAHGSTTASQTLSLPSPGANCSVDPVTGNLAVALQNQLGVAVFTPPYGQPTTYEFYGFVAHYCGYDNAGNLFIDGYKGDNPGLAEIPAGNGNVTYISLSLPEDSYPQAIQWDGNYMAMAVQRSQKINPHIVIDRLSISGSTATVASSTTIKGVKHHIGASWLYNNQVTIIYSISDFRFPNMGIWSYPKGGQPVRKIKEVAGKSALLNGVTVSVAPSR
jgi:hypothetical protein